MKVKDITLQIVKDKDNTSQIVKDKDNTSQIAKDKDNTLQIMSMMGNMFFVWIIQSQQREIQNLTQQLAKITDQMNDVQYKLNKIQELQAQIPIKAATADNVSNWLSFNSSTTVMTVISTALILRQALQMYNSVSSMFGVITSLHLIPTNILNSHFFKSLVYNKKTVIEGSDINFKYEIVMKDGSIHSIGIKENDEQPYQKVYDFFQEYMKFQQNKDTNSLIEPHPDTNVANVASNLAQLVERLNDI